MNEVMQNFITSNGKVQLLVASLGISDSLNKFQGRICTLNVWYLDNILVQTKSNLSDYICKLHAS